MTINQLLEKLNTEPDQLEFDDVMKVINENYRYTPVNFTCGDAVNAAGSNEGSCKILAFASLHDLGRDSTPYLFGRFYREDVVAHPDGEDHANIRNFIKHGWEGVSFEAEPLSPM